jgi:hypothetical protein
MLVVLGRACSTKHWKGYTMDQKAYAETKVNSHLLSQDKYFI